MPENTLMRKEAFAGVSTSRSWMKGSFAGYASNMHGQGVTVQPAGTAAWRAFGDLGSPARAFLRCPADLRIRPIWARTRTLCCALSYRPNATRLRTLVQQDFQPHCDARGGNRRAESICRSLWEGSRHRDL